MNLSTLVHTSLRLPNLPAIHSTSSTRNNATENIAIEGRNINFSVNTRQSKMVPILKDCSVCIPTGQLWMLLGPNGCGKSTLLKLTTRLVKGVQKAGTKVGFVVGKQYYSSKKKSWQVF